MKNYLVLAMFALGAVACEPGEPKNELATLAESQCSYADRKTVNTLSNREGAVRVTTTESEKWVDIYLNDDPNTPYCPCNIPESLSVEGTRVEFTAEVKEIYDNERWRCQPIVLKSIKKLSSEGK
ncbi:hypothetical protein [Telluribacter humicola]|uniref:hypothetical protein n=1 Tax=Telluribacter humicola TaxID=1720261 RepID=UPI001A972B29|nr:hypothetical protein [Telluribacter humicola]